MIDQDTVIATVIDQIQQDISRHQTDALFSLLMLVPTDQLVAFLPQQTQRQFGS